MNEAEFDKFADEYHASLKAGIALSGESPEYFSEYKIADIARECPNHARSLDASVKILDFGAGIGNSVPYVRKHFASAQLTCLDLSKRSLEVAQKRFANQANYVSFDGASIPFPENHFDIAYAMCVFHHIPHVDHVKLLQELHRVIKPGGKLLVLEFSKVAKPLEKPYDWYSFKVLPLLGKWVAGDDASYRYLAESIRMHPSQAELKAMMKQSGFGHVDFHNLTGGLVALHVGIRC